MNVFCIDTLLQMYNKNAVEISKQALKLQKYCKKCVGLLNIVVIITNIFDFHTKKIFAQ